MPTDSLSPFPFLYLWFSVSETNSRNQGEPYINFFFLKTWSYMKIFISTLKKKKLLRFCFFPHNILLRL